MCTDIDLRQRRAIARPTSAIKVPFNFRTALCVWSILLMTMVSIYSPIFGQFLNYLGLLFFLSLILLVSRNRVDIGSLSYSAFLILLLALAICIAFFRTVTLTDLKSWVATVVMVFFVPLVYSFVKGNKKLIVRALNIVIIFQALFIFLQLGYWLVTRQYLDVFYLISGTESRSFSSFGVHAFGSIVPRFTGLFVEPGTFSVVVMSVVLAAYSYERRITLPLVTGVVATLCTMSLFGVTLIVLLAALHLIRHMKQFVAMVVGMAGLGVAFYYSGGFAAVIERLQASGNGLGFRREMITFLFSSPDRMLLGVSVADYPSYVTVNDIGAWFALWMYFGVCGAAVFLVTILFAYKRTRSLVAVGIVVAILLTKLKFTYPLFWLLITCVIVFLVNDVRLKKPESRVLSK